MIYLTNNRNNKITTDSWLDYIPTNLLVYLDDLEIGTYTNESIYNEYIVLTIPATDLGNLQAREYTLKLYNNLSLLKVELVTVLPDTTFEIKTVNKEKKIVMYEK